MEFKLASMEHLEQIKALYKGVIIDMQKQDIAIWDDIYPAHFLKRI